MLSDVAIQALFICTIYAGCFANSFTTLKAYVN
jgi:hypothetical protein